MTDVKRVIELALNEPDAPGDIAEYDWTQLEQDAESDIPLHYMHPGRRGTVRYGWDPRSRRAVWRETPET